MKNFRFHLRFPSRNADRSFAPRCSLAYFYLYFTRCDVESEREETSYVVLSCLLREEEYLFIEMEMFRSEKKRFLLIKLNSAKSQ